MWFRAVLRLIDSKASHSDLQPREQFSLSRAFHGARVFSKQFPFTLYELGESRIETLVLAEGKQGEQLSP